MNVRNLEWLTNFFQGHLATARLHDRLGASEKAILLLNLVAQASGGKRGPEQLAAAVDRLVGRSGPARGRRA